MVWLFLSLLGSWIVFRHWRYLLWFCWLSIFLTWSPSFTRWGQALLTVISTKKNNSGNKDERLQQENLVVQHEMLIISHPIWYNNEFILKVWSNRRDQILLSKIKGISNDDHNLQWGNSMPTPYLTKHLTNDELKCELYFFWNLLFEIKTFYDEVICRSAR